MIDRPMQKYLGTCHCGAVKFEIETDFPELTTCDCSICRRKNALMVKVHEDRFKLLSGEGGIKSARVALQEGLPSSLGADLGNQYGDSGVVTLRINPADGKLTVLGSTPALHEVAFVGIFSP